MYTSGIGDFNLTVDQWLVANVFEQFVQSCALQNILIIHTYITGLEQLMK